MLLMKKGTRYSPIVPSSILAWREAGSVRAVSFMDLKLSTESELSERVT